MAVKKFHQSFLILLHFLVLIKAQNFSVSVVYEKLNFPVVMEHKNLIENERTGKIKSVTARTKLALLKERTFSGLSHLENFRLDGNKIKNINGAAFHNLQELTSANLSSNVLENLDFNIFVDVPRISHLYLNKNRLKTFEQRWLGCIFTLEWLDLSFNSFDKLATGTFSYLTKLLHLNLAHNEIILIESDAFYGLDNLEMLDLSYNKIGKLDNQLFVPFDNLKILNLYHNELSYVADQILENLKTLDKFNILFNPLQCGCHEKMSIWAENNSISFNANDFFKCAKIKDLSELPVCVTSTNSYTNCIAEAEDNMCDILYSQVEDGGCYFEYEKYLLEKL